jgi:divalent metal cation (Fe/Co/Zn/Cd) transporter
VRRGLRLNYLTIGYNSLEAIVSLVAGVLAGSVALTGFGVDSVIELGASAAAQWRLRSDVHQARRAQVEHVTVRAIGWSFLMLAAFVLIESGRSLWFRDHPDRSIIGIVILAMSIVVMPILARGKRRIATGLGSKALAADARQTSLCAYLSMIALSGVALNAVLGWWWADPVAALAMVPIIAKEGLESIRGEPPCDDCC